MYCAMLGESILFYCQVYMYNTKCRDCIYVHLFFLSIMLLLFTEMSQVIILLAYLNKKKGGKRREEKKKRKKKQPSNNPSLRDRSDTEV